MKIPLILDTDIGDDIDDALALALILSSHAFDLRGVTTVFRNAPRRAILADKLIGSFHQGIFRVAPGVSQPLLQPFDAKMGAQFQVLQEDGDEDFLLEWPEHGVDLLIEQCNEDSEYNADNLLTIAAIGPLTNIALALACCQELVSCARLTMMGGCWSEATAEWNVSCDPEAAAMVFNSGIEISMIGLDVTQQCQLSNQQIERIGVRHPLLGRLMKLWLDENQKPITLHDPLAILTLIEPDLVRFEAKRIEVVSCGDQRGQTFVIEGEANCRVAVEVDAERATARLTEILCA